MGWWPLPAPNDLKRLTTALATEKQMGAEDQPLFSIITVVFNAVSTIDATIDSVLEQKYSDYEYIVVDGGSTDGTLKILTERQNRFAFFVSEPDSGIYDAMNKALSHVRGAYVHFLNSDDVFADSEVLHDVAALIAKQTSEPDVVSGAVDVDYGEYRVRRDAAYSEKNLRRANMPPHQGLFLITKLMNSMGGFNTAFRSSADFDLLCRALRTGPNVVHEARLIAKMRSGGTSSDKRVSYSETAAVLRSHFGPRVAQSYRVRKLIFEQGVKRILQNLLSPSALAAVRRRYLQRPAPRKNGATRANNAPRNS